MPPKNLFVFSMTIICVVCMLLNVFTTVTGEFPASADRGSAESRGDDHLSFRNSRGEKSTFSLVGGDQNIPQIPESSSEERMFAPSHPRNTPEIVSRSENGIIYESSYLDRTIVVHEDESTYFDELLFTAGVPAAVHWEGNTRHECLLVYDTQNRETGNLHGDWDSYLEPVSGLKHLDLIGDVPAGRIGEIQDYYNMVDDTEIVTQRADIYNASADIARYYWGSERLRKSNTAILAYAPESDGGIQQVRNHVNTSQVAGYYNITTNASEVSWLEAGLYWSDLDNNTEYDLSLKDPYSTHHAPYNTSSAWFKEEPTFNVLNHHEGRRNVGLSPFYSYSPIGDLDGVSNATFSSSVGPTDGSEVPQLPFDDVTTHTIGPVRKGELVECKLEWEGESSLELYAHRNGLAPDQYEYEWWWGQPVILRFISPMNGYWNISVHTYTGVGGDYNLHAMWGAPSELEWEIYQCWNGDDIYTIEVKETLVLEDAVAESAANAAVLASLLDSPMLYTAGTSTPEASIVSSIKDLGIDNLIIVDPSSRIDINGWLAEGFIVEHLSDDRSVFNSIAGRAYNITGERDVVVPALGGPWFVAAALEGAAHGAPVPFPNDPTVLDATNSSTRVWWNMIENGDTLSAYTGGSAYTEDMAPRRSEMESIADNFFAWLGNFHPAYNPLCGDSDEDGVPDTGIMWDYSDSIDIVVVSPMNAIKMCFDRALIGKGSVGRIPGSSSPESASMAARAVLYWKIGHSTGKNPDDAFSVEDREGFDTRAGWTFVAYTHDDDVPDDNDLGDETDDDYSEMADGPQHLSYRMSEDLPAYATGYGFTHNDYNTSYPYVSDMLEDGLAFWCHADHGGYNSHFETGAGVIGVSGKVSNPWRDWDDRAGADIDNPDGLGDTDGLSNPSSLDFLSGNDLFYGIHDLPSTLIYLQDCQVGGSRMPVDLLKLGSAGVVGDHYSMYIDPSPVYNDRLVKGIFSGMDLGKANRWALDESSAMYSMHDPSPSGLGYSIQCTVFGDPETVLVRPTLRPYVTCNIPESGRDNATIVIYTVDQNGLASAVDMNVTINSMPLLRLSGDGGVGISSYNWTLEDTQSEMENILRIEFSVPGYYDRENNEVIVEEFRLDLPNLRVTLNASDYSGGWVQELSIVAEAEFGYSGEILNETSTSVAQVDIYSDTGDFGDYAGITQNLTFDKGQWNTLINVSSLPGGYYYANLVFGAPYCPIKNYRTPIFIIDHVMEASTPSLTYEADNVQKLDIYNITLRNSYTGSFNESEDGNYTFVVLDYYGNNTVVSGIMEKVGGKWEARNISTSYLRSGFYTASISFLLYGIEALVNTQVFTVTHIVECSTPVVEFIPGEQPQLEITGIQVISSLNGGAQLNETLMVEHSFSILRNHDFEEMAGGVLIWTGTQWQAMGIYCGNIPRGLYLVEVTFTTITGATAASISSPFVVEHSLYLENEGICSYQGDYIQRLDITGIEVGSYFNGSLEEGNITLFATRYQIIDGQTDIVMLEGDLTADDNIWGIQGIDVSSLTEGEYILQFIFIPIGSEQLVWRGGTFNVIHELDIIGARLEFEVEGTPRAVENVSMLSSYGDFESTLVTVRMEVNEVSTGETVLAEDLKPRNGKYSCTIDTPSLLAGNYSIKLYAETPGIAMRPEIYLGEFIVDVNITLGELSGTVKEGLLVVSPFIITSNLPDLAVLNDSHVESARYVLLSPLNDSILLEGTVIWDGGLWKIPEIDLSGVPGENYIVEVSVNVTGGYFVSARSGVISEEEQTSIGDGDNDGDDDGGGSGIIDTHIPPLDNLFSILMIVAVVFGILILVALLVFFKTKAREGPDKRKTGGDRNKIDPEISISLEEGESVVFDDEGGDWLDDEGGDWLDDEGGDWLDDEGGDWFDEELDFLDDELIMGSNDEVNERWDGEDDWVVEKDLGDWQEEKETEEFDEFEEFEDL